MIKSDSTGRAYAIPRGNGLPVRGYPHTPATEWALVGSAPRSRQAKDDPDVTVLVVPGTESILVVIAIDSPAIAQGFENVSPAVPIAILDPGNFGALGQV